MTTKERYWIKSMEWCKKYCGCHQMPNRSFFIKGYQVPICARCTGIALGHLIALIVMPFHTFSFKIAVLILPLAVDGTVQYFTNYESNNLKRIITGFLYGFAFMSFVVKLIRNIELI